MKITLDVPVSLLTDLMRHTGAKTKREAVVIALEDYNRRQNMAAMTKHLGTFEKFMAVTELNESRDAS